MPDVTQQISPFFTLTCARCGSPQVVVHFYAGYIHEAGGDTGSLALECQECGNRMGVDDDAGAPGPDITKPPCQRCGAVTPEEAETQCRVSGGDDDHCHGCDLWPD